MYQRSVLRLRTRIQPLIDWYQQHKMFYSILECCYITFMEKIKSTKLNIFDWQLFRPDMLFHMKFTRISRAFASTSTIRSRSLDPSFRKKLLYKMDLNFLDIWNVWKCTFNYTACPRNSKLLYMSILLGHTIYFEIHQYNKCVSIIILK